MAEGGGFAKPSRPLEEVRHDRIRSLNLPLRVMYVEVSDEAACSAGSFAINPFAR